MVVNRALVVRPDLVAHYVATYVASVGLSGERMCPGPLTGLTEFITVDGQYKTGDCGVCAVSHAAAVSDQKLNTIANEVARFHDMRAYSPRGVSPNGVTTMSVMVGYLQARGYPIVEWHHWDGSSATTLAALAALLKFAGVYPIMVQGAMCGVQRDQVTGYGMNANTRGPLSHFYTVVGRHFGGYSPTADRLSGGKVKVLPAGVWCADGDSMAVKRLGGRLVFYTDATMHAAALDAYAVVGYRANVHPVPTPTTPGEVAPPPSGGPRQGPNVARYPEAKWMPHHHFWPGRAGRKIMGVVLHGTASPGQATAEEIAHFFQTTKRQTGTNYVIGRDGTVVEMVHPEDSAWGNGITSPGHDPWWGANGNPNLETISIEHVKTSTDNHEGLTPAQRAASFRLVAWLCREYGIAPRKGDASGGVYPHASIDPVNRKFCPGTYPWAELWTYLGHPQGEPQGQGNGATSVALTLDEAGVKFGQYLVVVDDPKKAGAKCLARKDNAHIVIRGGLLDGYLSEPGRGEFAGLESLGLPLANEEQATDAHGNPLGDAWVQRFELGDLYDDPNHRVDSRPGVDGPYYHGHITRTSAPSGPALSPEDAKLLAAARAYAATQVAVQQAQAQLNTAVATLGAAVAADPGK